MMTSPPPKTTKANGVNGANGGSKEGGAETHGTGL